jgi:hypothetical protein
MSWSMVVGSYASARRRSPLRQGRCRHAMSGRQHPFLRHQGSTAKLPEVLRPFGSSKENRRSLERKSYRMPPGCLRRLLRSSPQCPAPGGKTGAGSRARTRTRAWCASRSPAPIRRVRSRPAAKPRFYYRAAEPVIATARKRSLVGVRVGRHDDRTRHLRHTAGARRRDHRRLRVRRAGAVRYRPQGGDHRDL